MATKKRSTKRRKGKTGNEGLNLQKAIKRPGRMTEWCKKHGYASATCSCLQKAKAMAQKKGDRSLLGAATLGLRLKGCRGYTLDKKGKRKK